MTSLDQYNLDNDPDFAPDPAETSGYAPRFSEVTYPRELWSEILDGLWQGGTADDDTTVYFRNSGGVARPGIDKDDFDFVTTLYAHAMPVDWFVKEIRFGVYDSDMSDFDPAETFEIVRMTHTAWKRGDKTLIRCQAGLNRSGFITALVLIRDGWDAQAAIDLIRRERSGYALFNEHFVAWLLRMDPATVRG